MRDVLERFVDLAHVVEQHGQRRPEDGLGRQLLGRLAEALEGLLRVIEADEAAPLDIQRVHVVLAALLCLLDVA